MRVPEAGDDRGAAAVDHGARGQVGDVVVEAEDPASDDAHGGGVGAVVVEGAYARTGQFEVEHAAGLLGGCVFPYLSRLQPVGAPTQ